jgi:hypothetical protein
LQRVKRETTIREYYLWLEYLEWDINAFHREDYYLAQIATEVRRTITKRSHMRSLDPKKFLIKFKLTKGPDSVEESSKKKGAAARGFFSRLLGTKRDAST